MLIKEDNRDMYEDRRPNRLVAKTVSMNTWAEQTEYNRVKKVDMMTTIMNGDSDNWNYKRKADDGERWKGMKNVDALSQVKKTRQVWINKGKESK